MLSNRTKKHSAPLVSTDVKQALNATQVAMLEWIKAGNDGSQATDPQRVSARSLATRRLVKIRGRGSAWHADLTEAGDYYLAHRAYPPGHFGAERPAASTTTTESHAEDVRRPDSHPQRSWPVVDVTVDSPAGKRRRGHRPEGDSLFPRDKPDPYDEKVLITVKEAAWMLSLPETAIRAAVANQDLDRVYIGEGTTRYRVVYGSLLAWVNSMPRESAAHRWWR